MSSDLIDFLGWLERKSDSGEIFMTEQTVRIVASYAVDYFEEKENVSSTQRKNGENE